ncbi:MAG: glycogen/starch/alpha-glucan phosphorylase [Desulfomonile tiedjei]|uniref:Alpha-1,4 glucan phosphorylase n=1 Tax=Desulfomonile tiedjei TaxID=2358 RepID=A0A9D6V550_9BACT|nr:glycogen/starch/alpha-glucan phosphorylase [Desulfomonile tiedjei]
MPENENARLSFSRSGIARGTLDHLYYQQARLPEFATTNDWYIALAHAVRDRLTERWIDTVRSILSNPGTKVVCYLSAEFLMGPQLGNAMLSLGITEESRHAMTTLGQDLNDLLEIEEEPGLGNGGLGRLAACYLDSLATLGIPAFGFGIRYEFGIFDQEIRNGWQVEKTDKWLRYGNPWEIHRPEVEFYVNYGGHTESYCDEEGLYRVTWKPGLVVKGVAYDTPVPGYNANTVNLLRLWKAEACESFDFQTFNVGDYYGAVDEKVLSETITKVLYPNDEPYQGKRLRLSQQYFFVSCTLQNLVHLCLELDIPLEEFHTTFAVQLNDTHPSIAVPELMRILVDEHSMEWDKAWEVTQRTFAYTNHTLLPEALEKWPLQLFASLLPRHLEIIYEINQRFLDEVREKYPDDDQRLERLSLIDENGEKYVRMAHVACVGGHAINGVAALHTELLKSETLRDFYELWPEKFHNITNGVTPRRWMALCNPGLASLITSRIGEEWVRDTEGFLPKLESFADDPDFQEEWQAVKLLNKQVMAYIIMDRIGIPVDPESMFDVHVKRIHEYKRQHLKVLHVVTLYSRIKSNPSATISPRTFIFGGKSAPSYFMAKLIIKLINSVASVVNNDPDVADRLKVVFAPDFNVKNGQHIYPAADLSEQISTAGKEASGTGNMKFAMNGALTIGTLDGANVEIRQEVGEDNFFLFGLTAAQVQDMKTVGYKPREFYESNENLRTCIDMIGSGHFSDGDTNLFRPLVDALVYHDEYMVLADYQSYIDCQDQVDEAFRDRTHWTQMSILNTARMGKFSSDRAIEEYCQQIWNAKPIVLGYK